MENMANKYAIYVEKTHLIYFVHYIHYAVYYTPHTMKLIKWAGEKWI